VVHLRSEKAAERKHEPAAKRRQWIEPQVSQIDKGEQARQEDVQDAQPDQGQRRR